ncbi:hypothetical protein [Amycolatopsis sp. cmx-11-51]|uniref:hypothetical protein n=1 Tax=Amycolatopsis sp. cmx-11-51 TaxID=2785797 RepID=UPI0039E668A4
MGQRAKIWYVVGVVGLTVGLAGMVLFFMVDEVPWWVVVLLGAIVLGAIVGGGLVAVAWRERLRTLQYVHGQELTLPQVRRAIRASSFGPVPQDPVVYRIAVDGAEDGVRTVRVTRWPSVGVFAVFLALGLLSLGSDPLWWVLLRVVFWSLMITLSLISPWWAAKRLARLRNNPPAGPSSTVPAPPAAPAPPPERSDTSS